MGAATYILKSSCIFTATQSEPVSGAVVVSEGRIAEVLIQSQLEDYRCEGAIILDFGDRTIMPGFNDSHVHFPTGAVQSDPHFCVPGLPDCRSEDDCVQAVKKFAAENPDNPWIYGCGWYSDVWTNPVEPTKASLDALELDRPVCLKSFDMHTVWLNSLGLEKLGITKDTPQPESGFYEHDDAGELTGLIRESTLIDDTVLNVPNLKSSLLHCLKLFREHGITAIADVYPQGISNPNVPELLHELELDGMLSCRVSMFPDIRDTERARQLRDTYNSDVLRVGGLKQIVDGVADGGTAYMSRPYANDPQNTGSPYMSAGELNELVRRADCDGFAVKLHAIGDAAIDMCLDAYENVRGQGDRGLHHSIEHIETIRPDEIERMAKLKILANVQPQHAVGGLSFDGYKFFLGSEMEKGLWPFREAVDAGVALALGTDFPAVYSLNPLWTIYEAVTRSDPDTGLPEEGYFREHALTLPEALTFHTRGSAYAESMEDRLGTLERGKLADIIVIDRNLFAIDPMEIRFAKVDMTMFSGKIIYTRG